MIKKIFLAAGIIVVMGYVALWQWKPAAAESMIFGVSFDLYQARYMGLDPATAFAATLDELGFSYVRLHVHWDAVEFAPGQWDWSQFDELMAQADKRGAKVTLAIGQKTPRWPECHAPTWAQALGPEKYRQQVLEYLRVVVERYRNHPALELWQVENEPFLKLFGRCPAITVEDFAEELALVKQLDPAHLTIATDSGELSSWRRTARAADLFGTTVYRTVWNRYLGYGHYDFLPVGLYRLKLLVNRRAPETAFVSELQAEPWPPGTHLTETSLEEQNKSLSLERLVENVSYARATGLPRAYLWGAEWWLWLREKRGVGDFVEYVKKLPKD